MTFFAYILDASSGISDAKFVGPKMVTPSFSTTSSGRAPSTFPPVAAAMSTITVPCLIFATASALISTGALRPGIAAVVMIKSMFEAT